MLEKSLASIDMAVNRGAELVRQILTFARKADQVFDLLDINVMIEEHVRMLSETFPKIISIDVELDPAMPQIYADPTQIHQTLLNLCVNARDAMPDGGTLLLQTKLVKQEMVKKRFSQASDEQYLCMSVLDTGIGMDEETVKRIFDPFFTTKEVGKGTGLGLPVVYGIMQGHRGFIDVESERGKGTAFHLYFPVTNVVDENPDAQQEANDTVPGGSGTILFIEDEEPVRIIATVQLEMNGYSVILAKDGEEAIDLYQHHQDEISLVFSDMGLPKLNGVQVFTRIKEINPKVKFIFASGFIEPEKRSELLRAGVIDILHKPYQASEMLRSIRDALTGLQG
ncbi:MAG: response regulator [Bacteroidetes bacterium]|nr:MAG: response regulator [Bacteroidota bacterium]